MRRAKHVEVAYGYLRHWQRRRILSAAVIHSYLLLANKLRWLLLEQNYLANNEAGI